MGQGMGTLKKRGSAFSSCRAPVPSGHVGAMKHLMEVPMSTTALLASEDALKPYINTSLTICIKDPGQVGLGISRVAHSDRV